MAIELEQCRRKGFCPLSPGVNRS